MSLTSRLFSIIACLFLLTISSYALNTWKGNFIASAGSDNYNIEVNCLTGENYFVFYSDTMVHVEKGINGDGVVVMGNRTKGQKTTLEIYDINRDKHWFAGNPGKSDNEWMENNGIVAGKVKMLLEEKGTYNEVGFTADCKKK